VFVSVALKPPRSKPVEYEVDWPAIASVSFVLLLILAIGTLAWWNAKDDARRRAVRDEADREAARQRDRWEQQEALRQAAWAQHAAEQEQRRQAEEDAARIRREFEQAAAESRRQAAESQRQQEAIEAEARRRAEEAEAPERLRLAVEAGQRMEQARREAQAHAHQARVDDLARRFGPDVAARLLRKEVWVGQTHEQLVAALGEPVDVDTKVLKTKTKQVFKYMPTGTNRYAIRITLDDGVVVGWEDKR
jgi:ATPase subunit of ABC transporter with duplicated ATPase domains